MFAEGSELKLCAILLSVSPLTTCTVPGVAEPAAASSCGAFEETAGEEALFFGAATTGALVSAGAGSALGVRLRAGGVVAADGAAGCVMVVGGGGTAAVLGAVTGAEERAFSPGVYTGGSSSTVYSRIKRPRAQFTSTKKVTNGSGIASVECTNRTSRPSLLLPTLKVNVDRNGGRSIP